MKGRATIHTLSAACVSVAVISGCGQIVGIDDLSGSGDDAAAGVDSPVEMDAGEEDASVISMTDSPSGRVGDGPLEATASEAHAPPPVYVTSLTAGEGGFTCAILAGGTASCWGANGNGQLGSGSSAASSLNPVTVLNISKVAAISAGLTSACAVFSGSVWCWGSDDYGQLGNGSTTVGEFGNDSDMPLAVPKVTGATDVAVGNSFACAVIGGSVQCWGSNAIGQLGNGKTTNATSPGPVMGLSGTVTAIAAGDSHACALLTSGSVQCWGWNEQGQLGNGMTTQAGVATTTPVTVSGLSGVEAIVAGFAFTCALVSGGAVKCWGANAGNLGNGSTMNSPTPVTASGLSGVTAITAGGRHACAILADKSVDCWGYTSLNQNSEFGNDAASGGNGTTTPVAVPGVSGVTAIAAGGSAFEGMDYSCAALAAGAVKCWGYNAAGQLGNGTMTNSLSPTPVVW